MYKLPLVLSSTWLDVTKFCLLFQNQMHKYVKCLVYFVDPKRPSNNSISLFYLTIKSFWQGKETYPVFNIEGFFP